MWRRRVRVAHYGDDGFTLVEMLVAIVVLSVLVAIVMIGIAQFRGESVSAACKADQKIVIAAATTYELQQGSYPTTLADLEGAGYVKDPPSGVTYTFHADAKTVSQDACTL